MSSAPAGSGNSGMGMNTVTTVMAFSVSAFFVLFVFTRLLCARIHLRTAAAEQAAAAHASNAAFPFPTITVERGIHGVEPSVVTAFPMVKLGDDSLAPPAQELSQCTVCLEECQAKDVVRVLPYCGHAFHLACIDTWLRQHSTCPICRASMRGGATAKHRAAMDMAPVYYAVAMARPAPPFQFQVATSSSDSNAVQVEVEAEPAAAAPVSDHADVTASRLEIVSDEALVSSGAACPSAAPSPSATEYPCSASVTTRQSPQGNASERSIASADTYGQGVVD